MGYIIISQLGTGDIRMKTPDTQPQQQKRKLFVFPLALLGMAFLLAAAVLWSNHENRVATAQFSQDVKAAVAASTSSEAEICKGTRSPLLVVTPPWRLSNEGLRVVIGGRGFKAATAELATLRITALPGGGYHIVTTDKEELVSCPPSLTPPLP
jgi:hypothetical protein